MVGNNAGGSRLLLAQFGMLMKIAPPRYQLGFNLCGTLPNFLFEIRDCGLCSYGRAQQQYH